MSKCRYCDERKAIENDNYCWLCKTKLGEEYAKQKSRIYYNIN